MSLSTLKTALVKIFQKNQSFSPVSFSKISLIKQQKIKLILVKDLVSSLTKEVSIPKINVQLFHNLPS